MVRSKYFYYEVNGLVFTRTSADVLYTRAWQLHVRQLMSCTLGLGSYTYVS